MPTSIEMFVEGGKAQRFIGEVAISKLQVSPHNPRRTRPDGRVRELADHIKRSGYDVTRAVKVHRDADGNLMVFAGGTRLEAARWSGRHTVPAFEFIGYSSEELWRLAYEDNDADGQHAQLPLVDVWADYADRHASGMTQQQIADALRISRPLVTLRLKLHGLPEHFKKAVSDGILDEGHLDVVSQVSQTSDALAAWLTTETAQAELLDEVMGKHRGSTAGVKPTVRVVREAANRWKTLVTAAEDELAAISKDDSDGRWAARFVGLLVEKKARTEAAVHTCRTLTVTEQKKVAEAERRRKQAEADEASRQAEAARQEEERRAAVEAFVAKAVLGDAREMLAHAPAGARLLLTDPPYGKDYETRRRRASPKKGDIAGDAEGVDAAAQLLEEVLTAAHARLADDATVLVFCDWRSEPTFRRKLELAGYELRGSLVWVKANHGTGDVSTTFAPRHERILHATKGHPTMRRRPDDVLVTDHEPAHGESDHPTAKPRDLLRVLIEATTDPTDIVLDPFAGSGGTLLAAAGCGRDFWGCEVDETWHRRIADALYALARGDKPAAKKRRGVTVEMPDVTMVAA